LRPLPGHAAAISEHRLRAAPGSTHLVSPADEQTLTWCYNGTVPGPEIRVRQGDRLRIVVANGLDEETTVHWHGVRTPNSMDGVPHLTQEPIAPGGRYVYEFDVPDAGTYWYHPHHRSLEQVGRGLYGALIVEERAPIAVDRDVVWVLDDWRLAADAQIVDDFANAHDMSHNGRVGNTVTVNGQIQEAFAVRRGERVRLRLVNAANARIFGLEFTGHRPTIIALDGQPVAPHEPSDGRVVIGPGMRVDLVLDMSGEPGERFTIKDTFYEGLEYRLLDLVYGAVAMRERPPEASISLAPNILPEPDLAAAVRHEIKFDGGMMGAMMMQGAGNMMEMMRGGKIWFINGVAATGHVMEPFLTLEQGRSYVLDMRSETAWHHPMHLHGHAFRVISRNGEPTTHREWQDTVLMEPRERVEIAFVADNPGDWMFHCHVLEHQASGMMGVIRVASQETKS
jgi:FtsP/CotA-like multicopper oxidase with cupredoxin domain